MCEFYAPLKACDEHLRFVFLTGITKFSQLSICSELNNLSNISLESDYAGICGITEDELHGRQAPDVAKFAEALGVGAEEAFGRLKDSYNGCPFVRVRRTSATPSAWSPLSPGGLYGFVNPSRESRHAAARPAGRALSHMVLRGPRPPGRGPGRA